MLAIGIDDEPVDARTAIGIVGPGFVCGGRNIGLFPERAESGRANALKVTGIGYSYSLSRYTRPADFRRGLGPGRIGLERQTIRGGGTSVRSTCPPFEPQGFIGGGSGSGGSPSQIGERFVSP